MSLLQLEDKVFRLSRAQRTEGFFAKSERRFTNVKQSSFS